MSAVINKVKAALSSDSNSTSTTHNTTTGSHLPGTTTHNTTAHSHNGAATEGAVGTHNSRVANAADPRIDSDLDGSKTIGNGSATHTSNQPMSHSTGLAGAGAGVHHGVGHSTGTQGAYTSTGTGTGLPGTHTGAHNTHSHNGVGHTAGGPGEFTPTGAGLTGATQATPNAGPHNSKLLNKADPRVDHDLDGSKTVGGTQNSNAYSSGTHTGAHSSAVPGTHATTNAGPHNSKVLNQADPRVDHDLDGSKTVGGTQNTNAYSNDTHTGVHNGIATSTHGTTTHSGQHNNPLAHSTAGHTANPVSSSAHKTSHATPGSGTATKTAGPHNSDLLNKLDPRVDSDLSGGKTFGGDKTRA